MPDIYADNDNPRFQYILGLADDALVLGQRWSEWLSRAPSLELDIASSNIALDLIGQAKLLLQLAATADDAGRDADGLAFLRDIMDFRNHLLTEQPNGDWGFTIARQCAFSTYQYILFERLSGCSDTPLGEIAAKSLKEVAYHRRFAADWAVRLSQGTEESHARMQKGFEDVWRFTGELFETSPAEEALVGTGGAVRAADLEDDWQSTMAEIFRVSGLQKPSSLQMMTGRLKGHHTEYLGHMLCEMQYLQRAYPGLDW